MTGDNARMCAACMLTHGGWAWSLDTEPRDDCMEMASGRTERMLFVTLLKLERIHCNFLHIREMHSTIVEQ